MAEFDFRKILDNLDLGKRMAKIDETKADNGTYACLSIQTPCITV